VSNLPTNPSLSDFIYRCSNLPRRQLGQHSESRRQVDVEVTRDKGRRRTNEVGARFPAVSEDARAVENAGRLLGPPLTVDPPDCFSHEQNSWRSDVRIHSDPQLCVGPSSSLGGGPSTAVHATTRTRS
jgi:hypothetical protein